MCPPPGDHRPIVGVVDDDASVRRALGRLLRSYGIEAMTFGSAAELLGDPRRRDAGCLLLDVRMPAMNGFELARRLAAEETAAPVIFITAHAEETDARARAAGGRALLKKPFDERDLVAALRDAIGPGFDPSTIPPDP